MSRSVSTEVSELPGKELEWWRALFHGSRDAIFISDSDAGFVQVNDAAVDLTGYEREDLLSMSIPDLHDDPDLDAYKKYYDRILAGEALTSEARVLRSNGDKVPVEFSNRPIEVAEEVYVHTVARDVTDRRRRQRALKRRSDAMEAATDGIAILDSDGRYIYVNRAHVDVYGYDDEKAFLGESWRMCYDGEELCRFEKEVMPTLWEHGWWRGEATGQLADGRSFPQELSLTTIEHGGLVCVVRDITNRKEREEQLRVAKQEAEEASRIKSAILANMSHEIRTPLTSVIGFAEVIGDHATQARGDRGEKHSTVSQCSQMIENSGRRLLETLDAVLRFSKLETGEMDLQNGSVDLVEHGRKTTAEFTARAEEARVDLAFEADVDSVLAWADEGGVQIVLRNLVSNAIKYTEAGGRIRVRAWAEEEAACVAVTDTGIGMNPEQVDDLFKAFKQASEGVSREYQGTGLGLALTKRVLEEMEGSIHVETEKGNGSRFVVRLPTEAGTP